MASDEEGRQSLVRESGTPMTAPRDQPHAPAAPGDTGSVTLDGYTLHVDEQTATLTVPAGRAITIVFAGTTHTIALDEAATAEPPDLAGLFERTRTTAAAPPSRPADTGPDARTAAAAQLYRNELLFDDAERLLGFGSHPPIGPEDHA